MENWQQLAIAMADTNVVSWRKIAQTIHKPRSTVSDFLRKYYELKAAGETKKLIQVPVERKIIVPDNKDNSRILVISDMHIPYHHRRVVPFLEYLKDKYKPTRVICTGDELDKHAMSFHDSDPDLFSAGHELEEAKKEIKKVHALFPEMDIIDSNHGSMVYRKAKHHGIPRQYIKSYNDVLEVGDGWKWHYDLTIVLPNGQPVYFHHGKAVDGLRLSQTMGMSCVQGHYHEKFNISYWANSLGLYFSMQVGCLIDDDSYAFAYNNVNLKRPIIGTGLIIDGVPVLEAMPL